MNTVISNAVKGIPGINIRRDTGKIRVRVYHEGKENSIGQGTTLSEALFVLNGNHWIDIEERERYKNGDQLFGFVYKVVDTTKHKAYIGRKQYKYYSRSTGKYSTESDWKMYCGSCSSLSREVRLRPGDFIFKKLVECKSREELGYAEHFLIRGIFGNKQVTGGYEYYNRMLPKLFMGQVECVSDKFIKVVKNILKTL